VYFMTSNHVFVTNMVFPNPTSIFSVSLEKSRLPDSLLVLPTPIFSSSKDLPTPQVLAPFLATQTTKSCIYCNYALCTAYEFLYLNVFLESIMSSRLFFFFLRYWDLNSVPTP
jgi:hypothetical protein